MLRSSALVMVVAAVIGGAGVPAQAASGLTGAQRRVLVDATSRFKDVRKAKAAGYLPTEDCVPGMGYHYSSPRNSENGDVDPVLPEILLYVPVPHGGLRLAGLEFFRPDADGDLRTDVDRPTLFGHPFDGPMAGHPVPKGVPPMPVHYDLHVWLYLPNPDGELTTLNPKVTCP
ncbi:hypothetical protein [Actinoplanes sp. NPDC051851]|uniref:hypothetical protein n=1 Tax=Actinoplanes sp. NPDC051851 TaxID=3154753 RepID=UPI0034306244